MGRGGKPASSPIQQQQAGPGDGTAGESVIGGRAAAALGREERKSRVRGEGGEGGGAQRLAASGN